MTKSDLTRKLATEMDITILDAEKIINGVFECMTEALVSGDRIEIRGVGSFEVREQNAYIGRNPMTGERVRVISKKIPFFKTGKYLKGRLLECGN